ncbi:MAG TPA: zinc transporter ZupT [Candidatus Scubalenecus merdavium]|uniref:Zinc transporter ZupT n=1 Tax=Candidatus Scybalenecus merdavium TaxID=2840939 RepID=A0A9D1MU65_9FIRM|nr:zinc transporter ZupT [Candidatus Scubalenecus merdavium]
MTNVLGAFLMTLAAGLCTGIGSCAAFFAKKTNKKFLSVSLGFSAGVMIYVSLTELMQSAQNYLTGAVGNTPGRWTAVLAFFGGIALIAVIDKLIPSGENPHEVKLVEAEQVPAAAPKPNSKKLLRMGMMTAVAVGVHNFPEGMATFVSALQAPSVAVPVVFAIAMHNIPEGIAVSVPVYQATGSKKKAFVYSFLSGLSEPVGALLGYLVLMPVMNDTVFGVLFAAVAGIMVFISFDELLPAAREYGEHHLSIYGLTGGMAVMAISLVGTSTMSF